MAEQPINELPMKTTPQTGDKVLISGASEEYLILIDKLADAVLNKLTSKTFALEQGNMTLLAALNALNSKIQIGAATTTDGMADVQFKRPFAEKPKVFVQLIGTSENNVSCAKVKSVEKTGFSVVAVNIAEGGKITVGTGWIFQWVAIEQ